MQRRDELVAGEQTLDNFQIFQCALKTGNRIQALLQPGLRGFDDGHSEDLESLNRDVARLDKKSVRSPAERIRWAVPGRRDCHWVYERGHSADVPGRVVGQHLSANGQTARVRERFVTGRCDRSHAPSVSAKRETRIKRQPSVQ